MDGIIYFNHSRKHLARLVVSLYSLRQHYAGPVTILDTGDESAAPFIAAIVSDKRLAVDVKTIPLFQLRRHSCYVTKASLWRHSPYDVTLYLDADTVVAGDVEPLFVMARTGGSECPYFVATQFSNWNMAGSKIVRSRVEQWRNVQADGMDVPGLVEKSLSSICAAINTGVVAWRTGSPFLQAWETLTRAGWRCSFTDELAVQLLLSADVIRFPAVIASERFNASPIYTRCVPSEVAIWHFHGHKERRPEAIDIWLPIYRDCWLQNIADLQSWGEQP